MATNADLQARLAALEVENEHLRRVAEDTQNRFRTILEVLPDVIILLDEDGRYLEIYASNEDLLYAPLHQLRGQLMRDVLPPEQAAFFLQVVQRVIASESSETIEYEMDTLQGREFFEATVVALELRTDSRKYAACVTRSVTERKRAEKERERLQRQMIEAQQQMLRELSTPIIPLMNGILIMPLVGSVDSTRAREIMRSLLAGIGRHRAKIVILDITGVPVVDSDVAGHLDKTIQAARLKGARTIITGVSDAVAEAIIDLGIDWSSIETLRDLQTGLLAAMEQMGMRVSGVR